MIRNHSNPFEEMMAKKFMSTFGFSKDQAISIHEQYKDDLQGECDMATALSSLQKILFFLAYIRSGDFYRCLGNQKLANAS